jgi:hypothetical protein
MRWKWVFFLLGNEGSTIEKDERNNSDPNEVDYATFMKKSIQYEEKNQSFDTFNKLIF